MLIDFIPAYLFPHNERKIDLWVVLGKSLGGHSTWIALRNGVYPISPRWVHR